MENQTKNNTNESFEKSLEILTEWYLQQPHLPQRYVGNFLRSFLAGCKMSIERAKKKLDNYFYYRNLYPEILLPPDITDPTREELYIMRTSVILPKCTPEGHRVHLIKDCGYTSLDPKVVLQMSMITFEVACLENSFQSGGVIILLDLQTDSLKGVIQQASIARFYHILQSVSPHQTKATIIVNATKLTEKGLNIYRSTVSEKLRERFHVVPAGQIEKLANYIPVDILPKEYGGNEESFDVIREKWFKKLQYYYENWFSDRKNMVSDESKRPPHMKRNEESVLGVEGSFKQLAVD